MGRVKEQTFWKLGDHRTITKPRTQRNTTKITKHKQIVNKITISVNVKKMEEKETTQLQTKNTSNGAWNENETVQTLPSTNMKENECNGFEWRSIGSRNSSEEDGGTVQENARFGGRRKVKIKTRGWIKTAAPRRFWDSNRRGAWLETRILIFDAPQRRLQARNRCCAKP